MEKRHFLIRFTMFKMTSRWRQTTVKMFIIRNFNIGCIECVPYSLESQPWYWWGWMKFIVIFLMSLWYSIYQFGTHMCESIFALGLACPPRYVRSTHQALASCPPPQVFIPAGSNDPASQARVTSQLANTTINECERMICMICMMVWWYDGMME